MTMTWMLIIGLLLQPGTVVTVDIPMESEAACRRAAAEMRMTRRGPESSLTWLDAICEPIAATN